MSLAKDVTYSNVAYNISSLRLSVSIPSVLLNNNNNKKNNKSKSLILKKNFTLNKLNVFLEDFKKIKN